MIFKNISHLLSFFVIPLKMWGKKKEIFPQKKKNVPQTLISLQYLGNSGFSK